jgi:hypothetical protein
MGLHLPWSGGAWQAAAMVRYVALALALAACGDNLQFVDQLRALPGVHDVTEMKTQTPGFQYFVLHFEQPVDHADPHGQTFLQEVSLLHRDAFAPMIVHTSGYWDYYLDHYVELTALLGANQISIEHRFFAGSRPDPADWTKLTIEQMADDEHAIVSALKDIYHGAYISTGGSKGGMTAIFYRRFFPDDVDGTVPYVAPISFGAPDERYPAFVASLGPTDCHAAVKALAVEMLSNRRAAFEQRAQAQADQKHYMYTRIALGPAVESAIQGLEWSFWQYFGVGDCPQVPDVTASDDALFSFLDTIDPPSDNDDEQTGLFDAYYFQADFQLGYPDDGTDAYLKPFEIYTDADFVNALPTTDPAFDGGAAMQDIDAFVQGAGNRFIFVYGEWDPWTGGAFELGNARDSLRLIQPQGTHGSRLTHLAPDDTTAALAKLAAWTGVTPAVSAQRTFIAERPIDPHVPSALRRALRARRNSH